MKAAKMSVSILAFGIAMSVAGCGGSGGNTSTSQTSGSGGSGGSGGTAQTDGGSGGNGTVQLVGTQMGGARQGTPLSLAGVVTTPPLVDGTGAAAATTFLSGVTTDGTNLYVVDSGNNAIRKIVIATGAMTTLAGIAGVTGASDGPSSAATFNKPVGITTDGTNLYLADTGNNTIRSILIATGEVKTVAGTAGKSGSADGTGSAARFNEPVGITTDETNLYVTDDGNSTIRKIVIATGEVTTLAGVAGTAGASDGPGDAATFNDPDDITTDGRFLYVADDESNTIRQVEIATRVVKTLAGTAGTSGSANATGANARFNGPHGITTDGTNIYVAEYGNNTIRQIVIGTGVVTTVAGMPGTTATVDGTGADARFFDPIGITTDGRSVYVVNAGSSTVRKIN